MVTILKRLKRRLTKKQKLFLSFFALMFVGILFLNYLNTYVNPVIISVSEAKVRALSVLAVNNAIGEVVSDPNIYNTLINIEEDSNGKISLIQANTIAVNYLNKQLMSETQKQIENMGATGVQIPLGSFSGLPVFNGMGPKVNIRLFPVGNVQCTFQSEFISAGINQTNHKIYVNLETRISLVLPLATKQVSTMTQMLICESIIVGSVPDVYIQTSTLDQAMNLIPIP